MGIISAAIVDEDLGQASSQAKAAAVSHRFWNRQKSRDLRRNLSAAAVIAAPRHANGRGRLPTVFDWTNTTCSGEWTPILAPSHVIKVRVTFSVDEGPVARLVPVHSLCSWCQASPMRGPGWLFQILLKRSSCCCCHDAWRCACCVGVVRNYGPWFLLNPKPKNVEDAFMGCPTSDRSGLLDADMLLEIVCWYRNWMCWASSRGQSPDAMWLYCTRGTESPTSTEPSTQPCLPKICRKAAGEISEHLKQAMPFIQYLLINWQCGAWGGPRAFVASEMCSLAWRAMMTPSTLSARVICSSTISSRQKTLKRRDKKPIFRGQVLRSLRSAQDHWDQYHAKVVQDRLVFALGQARGRTSLPAFFWGFDSFDWSAARRCANTYDLGADIVALQQVAESVFSSALDVAVMDHIDKAICYTHTRIYPQMHISFTYDLRTQTHYTHMWHEYIVTWSLFKSPLTCEKTSFCPKSD